MANTNKFTGRNVLSIEQRFEIVQHLKSGASVGKLAAGYDVHPATIRRIRQRAVTVCQLAGQGVGMRKRKSLRKPANEELDNRLYTWFLERKENGYAVTDALLLEKAIELNKEFGGPSTFKASRGWLWNFKNRRSIRLSHNDGKEGRHMTAMQQFSESFTRRVKEEGIKYENIYKLDEASLIWKALPRKMQASDKERRPNEELERDQVNMGLCANVIGSHKLTPIFIYKSENPRALKHCKDRLSVLFKVLPRLSIDQVLFTNWYQNQFKPAVRTHQFETNIYGRVILLLDNFQKHNIQLPEEFRQDDYFEIIFLPPCNSPLQYMNRRIIEKVKKSYRYKMFRKLISFSGRVREFCFDYDLKDCIDLLYEAWSEMSVSNIRNAMRNVITEIPKEIPTKEEPDPLELNLQDIIGMITGEQTSEESVNEFLSRCTEMENNFYGNVKQEEIDKDSINESLSLETPTDKEEEEIKKAFKILTKWSKREPDFIRSHLQCLKEYYEQE